MTPSTGAHSSSPAFLDMVRLATIPARQLLAETKSALLLVDTQNRFIMGPDPASPLPSVRMLKPIETLLATARARDVPRFFVTVGHAPASESAPWLRRLNDMGSNVTGRVGAPELPAWASEIPASIAPIAGEIHLTKWRFSAFYETALDVLLRGAGVRTLVIGGVASYGCIIATYIDACSRGFFPLLCAQAVEGLHPEMHKAAMDFMGANCRLDVEEIVETWEARSEG